MSEVRVSPDVLRWARARSGLGFDDSQGRFPKLPAWEAEVTQPTLKQLETCARATPMPFGSPSLPEPPETRFPFAAFRTVESRRPQGISLELIDTIHIMRRRQAWLREERMEAEAAPVSLVGAARLSDDPEAIGYEKPGSDAYDEALALFPEDVCGFLKDTQPVKWAALEALLSTKTEMTLLSRLSKELVSKGTLHDLRHGCKYCGKTFRIAWFRPNTKMNPEATEYYVGNQLTVTRQVAFTSVMKRPDGKNRSCVIDVTLAVNGIPVVTAECGVSNSNVNCGRKTSYEFATRY